MKTCKSNEREDSEGREGASLIEYFGLSEEPTSALQAAASIIVPNISTVVKQFYDRVMAVPGLRSYIPDHVTRQRLEQAQCEYLTSLVTSPLNSSYVEQRIVMGAIHHQIGLDEVYMASAYAIYVDLLTALLHNLPPRTRENAMSELFRRILFDLGLAMRKQFRSTYSTLQEKASRDYMTGLYGRNYLQLFLEEMLQRPDGHFLSLVMVDVDHFKKVNDTYGHLVGDAVLEHISRILNSKSRNDDVVARYGGEEFCIVLPNTDLEMAVLVAKEIHEAIMNSAFAQGELYINLTVSVGVTTGISGDDVHTLISRADNALYQAKGCGRNRVMVFNLSKNCL